MHCYSCINKMMSFHFCRAVEEYKGGTLEIFRSIGLFFGVFIGSFMIGKPIMVSVSVRLHNQVSGKVVLACRSLYGNYNVVLSTHVWLLDVIAFCYRFRDWLYQRTAYQVYTYKRFSSVGVIPLCPRLLYVVFDCRGFRDQWYVLCTIIIIDTKSVCLRSMEVGWNGRPLFIRRQILVW